MGLRGDAWWREATRPSHAGGGQRALASDGGPAGKPTGKRRATKPKRRPRKKR